MHYDFKRSVNKTVVNIFMVLCIITLVGAIVEAVVADHVTIYSEVQKLPGIMVMCVTAIGFEVLAGVASCLIPPDFKYTIRVIEDEGKEFFIFENGNDDHRRLSTKFEITAKNYKYMTLDDGYARVRIAYDKSVVEFLNGVKK